MVAEHVGQVAVGDRQGGHARGQLSLERLVELNVAGVAEARRGAQRQALPGHPGAVGLEHEAVPQLVELGGDEGAAVLAMRWLNP